MIKIPNITKKKIEKFVFSNNFDCYIVKKGQSFKFSDETSDFMCLPEKLRGINYHPPGTESIEQDQAPQPEIQQTSIKNGRLWTCDEEGCDAEYMEFSNLEKHIARYKYIIHISRIRQILLQYQPVSFISMINLHCLMFHSSTLSSTVSNTIFTFFP